MYNVISENFKSKFKPCSTFFVLVFILFSINLRADSPPCQGFGRDLIPIDNSQVLNWQRTTHNQFRSRGHVLGKVTRFYSDKSGHDHFQLAIGSSSQESIEIIYNQEFGSLPATMKLGSTVEACGDYITANSRTGHYPASPDGAIIHWVHKASRSEHPSGFLVVDGQLCGWN